MTISHSVPSNTRKPGEFHEFDLVSGAQSLVPLTNRVLLIGCKLAGGTATADTAYQIYDELQSDGLFGAGSEVALMVRAALAMGRKLGVQPEIWAMGVADPAGTAATYTFTVGAGTAAADGDIVFRIAGRTLRAGVSSGDDQDTVAAAIKTAIDEAEVTLPGTAASALAVCTFTCSQTGVNGNDVDVSVEDVGLTGLTVTAAAGVAGVGAATIATALANSLSRLYECKAIANHASADITSLKTHLTSAWAAAAKRWCFCLVAETGTLSAANTLSAAADIESIVVLSYENSPQLPGEIAAMEAVAISGREQPNYNWDYDELPIYATTDASVYTDAEVESALSAGSTPLKPNDAGDASETVRMITTKTTQDSNPFENAKDLATIRGMVYCVRQIDSAFAQQFRGVNKSARVLKRMRSVAYRVLKQLEEREITQNVDALFDQLLVETDPNVATRAVVAVPESIVPNLHQSVFKHILFVE
jgi:phage tail sheath gpL-like